MSVDRSLRGKTALSRHRNVLTRAERVDGMKKNDLWKEGMSAIGLPKLGNRKVRASKKSKKDAAAEGGATAAAPAAAPAKK